MVPLVDDLQRREDLLAEEVTAARVAGERHEGVDQRVVAQVVAEVGFEAPEGDEVTRRHPVVGDEIRQQLPVLGEDAPPALDPRRGEPPLEVSAEILGGHRLAAVELQTRGGSSPRRPAPTRPSAG